MANHLRRQIREAIATAVTGLATTASRVFQSRVYPLQEAELPALKIETLSEASIADSFGPPRILQRTLTVRISAVAKATADLDDTLDQICKEVEIALANPVTQLAGVAKSVTLTGTETSLDGESDQPTGRAVLTYEVLYLCAENAPDVGL